MYEYNARVTEVYDGDTITVSFDLGLNIWSLDQKIRLYGIDTPEMRGDEKASGTVVRDYVRSRILGRRIRIKTFKDKTGKYGRWLGLIFIDGMNLNEELIEKGYAERAEY